MYGLIGKTLKHSFSPNIHRLIDDYNYELIEKNEDDAIKFIKSKNFNALNITIPYKTTFMNMCDYISENAQKIGCINTIVQKNNKLYGYNTDYFGLMSMFHSQNIQVNNKNVLILGDGATSLTAQVVLEDMGAKSIIKASRKGRINFEDYSKFEDIQIVLNCTPVGMYPNNLESLINLDNLPNIESVADVIYNPLSTKLILDAKKKNIKTCDGLIMLVTQAIKSAQIFTQKKYDDSLAIRINNCLRKDMSNIVLIGMPGSGKTTLSKKISKLTGKKFVDTDEIIVQKCNMSIPDIFEKFGENYFRNIEKDVINQIGKEHNSVISTGGGVVINESNYYPLKQNSVIFYIQRDLSKLPLNGRPLSQQGKNAIQKLFEQRKPLYEYFSDHIVHNENIDICSKSIVDLFNFDFK